MIIIHQSSAYHEIKLVFIVIRKLIRITNGILLQTLVTALVGRNLKHVLTDVEAYDLFEAMCFQVLADEACAAAKIEDTHVRWILILSHLLYKVGYLLGIGPACSVVEAFVVGCDVIKMPLRVALLILVAPLH